MTKGEKHLYRNVKYSHLTLPNGVPASRFVTPSLGKRLYKKTPEHLPRACTHINAGVIHEESVLTVLRARSFTVHLTHALQGVY